MMYVGIAIVFAALLVIAGGMWLEWRDEKNALDAVRKTARTLDIVIRADASRAIDALRRCEDAASGRTADARTETWASLPPVSKGSETGRVRPDHRGPRPVAATPDVVAPDASALPAHGAPGSPQPVRFDLREARRQR